jgi:hypothetical protein
MLQQDPAEISAALLLQIARSQQRLESGSLDMNSTLIESPPFIPTAIARWINGLWFTALALSLAAALVAMLAKEWLAEFITTTVRPPYEYALLRQAKYNGLISWGALHIIALLPTLLHLSLLFFSLGTILFLWDLDEAIALVIIFVAGSTAFFYIATAILGAIFESCPFVTCISKYVGGAWSACLGDHRILKNNLNSTKLLRHDSITEEVLQALGWLASNSRDKAVADCAYQALAAHTGMNGTPIRTDTAPNPTTITHHFSQPEPTVVAGKPMTDSEKATSVKFLHAICQRFSDAVAQKHREVAACQGMNIARYAAAMPELVEHVESFVEEAPILSASQVAKTPSYGWALNQVRNCCYQTPDNNDSH